MKTLAEVLAEEWIEDGGVISLRDPDGPTILDTEVEDEEDPIRRKVVLLGKRALAVLLTHHTDRDGLCNECGSFITGVRVRETHAPDCESAKIVAEAKGLG